MAVGLAGDDLGHLYDPCGGRADLEAGDRARAPRRQLHRRPDPPAARRPLRDPARLPHGSRDRAPGALGGGGERASHRVGGAGARRAAWTCSASPRRPRRSRRLPELGLDRALHPALDADPELVASAALGAVAIGADRGLAASPRCARRIPLRLDGWLSRSSACTAGERDAVARAARVAPRIAAQLGAASTSPPSCGRCLGREPPESLALALAIASAVRADAALGHRSVLGAARDHRRRPAGGGGAGGAGPRVAHSTRRCDRKLDGLVSGRDEELQTALAIARETGP